MFLLLLSVFVLMVEVFLCSWGGAFDLKFFLRAQLQRRMAGNGSSSTAPYSALRRTDDEPYLEWYGWHGVPRAVPHCDTRRQLRVPLRQSGVDHTAWKGTPGLPLHVQSSLLRAGCGIRESVASFLSAALLQQERQWFLCWFEGFYLGFGVLCFFLFLGLLVERWFGLDLGNLWASQESAWMFLICLFMLWLFYS